MKVKVYQVIHAYSQASFSPEDVTLVREFDMPFPPWVGLQLDEAGSDWYCKVAEVAYACDTGVFECWAENHTELQQAARDGRPGRPVEDIVQEYLDSGWEREVK